MPTKAAIAPIACITVAITTRPIVVKYEPAARGAEGRGLDFEFQAPVVDLIGGVHFRYGFIVG